MNKTREVEKSVKFEDSLEGTWSHLWFQGIHECPPWYSLFVRKWHGIYNGFLTVLLCVRFFLHK